MNDMQKQFKALTRRIIEKRYSGLNPMQRQAVFAVNGPVLILAGAGSGKTTVLVNRIDNMLRFGNAYHSQKAPEGITEEHIDFLKGYLDDGCAYNEEVERLISQDRVMPFNIIAITFTNKAAGELKERLCDILGEHASDLWACTFHSACVRILRISGENAGIPRNFSIYDADDTIRVIKDCLKELKLDDKRFAPKMVYSQISRAKNKLIDANEFEEKYSGDYFLSEISKVYKLYSSKLKSAFALDFDDLIMQTVKLLSSSETVLKYYQNRFKYVLVDEYQDTNHAQYMLVSLLAGAHNNICVVGDDDQSIYKFRGATIENILDFEEQYPGALVIRLEQNYRSTKNILSAANNVIKNNSSRKDKSLWTDNISGDKIRIFEAHDEDDEGRFIAKTISECVSHEQKHFSDFAVLYRMNAQSSSIERVFARSGIPYRIIGGTRFYERREIKDVIAYLHLTLNTGDDLRLKRVINQPKRGIGPSTLELLESVAQSLNKSMFETMLISDEIDLLKSPSKRLKDFAALILSFKNALETLPLDEFIRLVFVQSGYFSELEQQNNDESRQRIENIKQLVSNAVLYKKENPDGTLLGFLEEIALFTDIDNHDPSADSVVLMTVHSAKGLEFDTVFLCGADEGLFPSALSITTDADIEEERRLCYVAITRAKRRLYITRANGRVIFGKSSFQMPSRFLKELPDDCTEYVVKRTAPVVGIKLQHAPEYKEDRMSMFAKQKAGKKESKPAQSFAVGETVEHKIFGKGMVLTVKPMGNDIYLEVAFENAGTKKIMANFAGLKKI